MVLTDKLKAVADEIKASIEDGKITFVEAYRVVGAIIKAAAEAIELLENPGEHFEEVVSECEAFYDSEIAPYDIRAIPNWVEPAFDALLRGAIRPAIAAIFDAVSAK
jgi:hypothetical protein